MRNPSSYIGVGIYTIPQAAKLLRVNGNLLHYWVGDRAGTESIIQRTLKSDELLTFEELMELHFVKLFLDQKVSLQTIRKAAREAARKFHSEYPFTVKRFDTDGRSIFATLRSEARQVDLVEELKHGQLVFQQMVKPFFKKLDYRSTDNIERFWPLTKSGRVVLDPNKRFGEPIDAATGVPTEAIFKAFRAGDGQDAPTVAKWFDIPLEAVKAAVQFEQSLAI